MVASLVGSPEAKGLFQRAIAESGAWMGLGIGRMTPRDPAEETGKKLGSLAELRLKPTDEMMRIGRSTGILIDGWIIPEDLSVTFAQGRQNEVDLLVGSNQDEGTFFAGGQRGGGGGATNGAQQFIDQSKQRFGDMADSFFKLYPASSDGEASTSQFESRSRRNGLAYENVGKTPVDTREGEGLLVLLHTRSSSRCRADE